MKYGDLPEHLGVHKVDVREMMFYQYLPIKLRLYGSRRYERRLCPFSKIIDTCIQDFICTFGAERFYESYVYVTAKHLYQSPGHTFNRPGWHSDGFLTDDINYIWSDKGHTVFNTTEFNLSADHEKSILEMSSQAFQSNNVTYDRGSLLRLNQYNIHRCGTEYDREGMRAFLKVSFSRDEYNLEGNSHNYDLNYKWPMVPRKKERNHPIA